MWVTLVRQDLEIGFFFSFFFFFIFSWLVKIFQGMWSLRDLAVEKVIVSAWVMVWQAYTNVRNHRVVYVWDSLYFNLGGKSELLKCAVSESLPHSMMAFFLGVCHGGACLWKVRHYHFRAVVDFQPAASHARTGGHPALVGSGLCLCWRDLRTKTDPH